jgi:hypothetical protein
MGCETLKTVKNQQPKSRTALGLSKILILTSF